MWKKTRFGLELPLCYITHRQKPNNMLLVLPYNGLVACDKPDQWNWITIGAGGRGGWMRANSVVLTSNMVRDDDVRRKINKRQAMQKQNVKKTIRTTSTQAEHSKQLSVQCTKRWLDVRVCTLCCVHVHVVGRTTNGDCTAVLIYYKLSLEPSKRFNSTRAITLNVSTANSTAFRNLNWSELCLFYFTTISQTDTTHIR